MTRKSPIKFYQLLYLPYYVYYIYTLSVTMGKTARLVFYHSTCRNCNKDGCEEVVNYAYKLSCRQTYQKKRCFKNNEKVFLLNNQWIYDYMLLNLQLILPVKQLYQREFITILTFFEASLVWEFLIYYLAIGFLDILSKMNL